MIETDFIIRAALSEETNDGWVWVHMPAKSFAPRTIVRVDRRLRGHRFRTYVEARTIDDNFRRNYNACSKRIAVVEQRDTLVMAEWYRDALRIPRTTAPDNVTDMVSLSVVSARMPVWPSLRAACHHPALSVRLGTRLGMVGVCLGVVGLWVGLLGTDALQDVGDGNEILGVVCVIVLPLLAILASRGPYRSRRAQ